MDALLRVPTWNGRGLVDLSRTMPTGGFLPNEPHLSLVQIANSYIEGLEPIPFHEVKDFPWMMELEKHSETIRKEFILRNAQDLSKGNRIWETALTVEAFAYGRDWRTLVLQDRGRWDPINAQLFPRTVEIVKKSNAPT